MRANGSQNRKGVSYQQLNVTTLDLVKDIAKCGNIALARREFLHVDRFRPQLHHQYYS